MSRADPPSAPADRRASARAPQHAAQRLRSADRPRCWLAPAPAPGGATSPCCPASFLSALDLGARGALYSMPSTCHPIPGPRLVQRALAGGVSSPTAMRPARAVTRRAVRCRPLLCPPPHRTPALPFRGLASSPLCLSPSPSTPAADPALTRASPIWSRTRAPARPSRAADGGPENDALSVCKP